jgi:hypothetical protein
LSDHITPTQIEDYGRRPFPAAEWLFVSDHLSVCEECRLKVEGTVDFEATYLALKSGVFDEAMATESRWRRLVATIPSFWPKSSTLIFGSAVATLLLAVASWLGWQALQRIKARPKVAVTIPSPGVSPPASPSPHSEGAPIIIAKLNDGGGQVTLDREGNLSGVDHLPPAYQQMIRRALTVQELERSPLLAELFPPGDRPRGDGGVWRVEFSVIEPVGVVTLSDRPTFRWSQLNGATGYVVEVYDERFNLAAASPQITDHSWTAPRQLKRGGIYYWQVKALKEGRELKSPRPPAPQAKFRVLDAARANELAQARRAYASSRLTLGLLYAQAGLLYEAEREFRALQEANPNSELAHRLLKQVRTKS